VIEAVRDGHTYIAPAEPFGCIEQPPSINRLAGLGWLEAAIRSRRRRCSRQVSIIPS
jgi:hypothetical protein